MPGTTSRPRATDHFGLSFPGRSTFLAAPSCATDWCRFRSSWGWPGSRRQKPRRSSRGWRAARFSVGSPASPACGAPRSSSRAPNCGPAACSGRSKQVQHERTAGGRSLLPRCRDAAGLVGGVCPRRDPASLQRWPGVAVAAFPHQPERAIYNNALLERDLGAAARVDALDAMEAAYAEAGVAQFAAWVHEADGPMRAALEDRRYTFDSATRAMGLVIDDVHFARAGIRYSSSGLVRLLARVRPAARPPQRRAPWRVPRPGRVSRRRPVRRRARLRSPRRLRDLQCGHAGARSSTRPGYGIDRPAGARCTRAWM